MFWKNYTEFGIFWSSFEHQCSYILLKCKVKVFSNIISTDPEHAKYHKNSKIIPIINPSKSWRDGRPILPGKEQLR